MITLYESTKVQQLVKDKEWQKIRLHLKGKWKDNPKYCCKVLRNYLGDIRETTDNKLRIVLNYLTGSGFRIGIIQDECINVLLKRIRKEILNRKQNGEWTL